MPAAIVVTKPRASICESELRSFLEQRLEPASKLPRTIEFREEPLPPKTGTDKIRKTSAQRNVLGR